MAMTELERQLSAALSNLSAGLEQRLDNAESQMLSLSQHLQNLNKQVSELLKRLNE